MTGTGTDSGGGWDEALHPSSASSRPAVPFGKSALQAQVEDLTARVAALEERLDGREVRS